MGLPMDRLTLIYLEIIIIRSENKLAPIQSRDVLKLSTQDDETAVVVSIFRIYYVPD